MERAMCTLFYLQWFIKAITPGSRIVSGSHNLLTELANG